VITSHFILVGVLFERQSETNIKPRFFLLFLFLTGEGNSD